MYDVPEFLSGAPLHLGGFLSTSFQAWLMSCCLFCGNISTEFPQGPNPTNGGISFLYIPNNISLYIYHLFLLLLLLLFSFTKVCS